MCTPYAVLIAPGPLGLSVDADANVTNAVVATVAADGVLRLGSTSFSSGRPIKMTVRRGGGVGWWGGQCARSGAIVVARPAAAPDRKSVV